MRVPDDRNNPSRVDRESYLREAGTPPSSGSESHSPEEKYFDGTSGAAEVMDSLGGVIDRLGTTPQRRALDCAGFDHREV